MNEKQNDLLGEVLHSQVRHCQNLFMTNNHEGIVPTFNSNGVLAIHKWRVRIFRDN